MPIPSSSGLKKRKKEKCPLQPMQKYRAVKNEQITEKYKRVCFCMLTHNFEEKKQLTENI